MHAYLVAPLVGAPEPHHHPFHQQLAVFRQLGVEHCHQSCVNVREPDKSEGKRVCKLEDCRIALELGIGGRARRLDSVAGGWRERRGGGAQVAMHGR